MEKKPTCTEKNPNGGTQCGLPFDHDEHSVFRVHNNGTMTRSWITQNPKLEVKDKTLTE